MARPPIDEAFCPQFHEAAELVGRRWTGAIIRALLADRTSRFGDLVETIPGISGRMLSERLKELESAGVLKRHVHPETPVRVEYELTAKGRALVPVVKALTTWAEHWIPAKGHKHRRAG